MSVAGRGGVLYVCVSFAGGGTIMIVLVASEIHGAYIFFWRRDPLARSAAARLFAN